MAGRQEGLIHYVGPQRRDREGRVERLVEGERDIDGPFSKLLDQVGGIDVVHDERDFGVVATQLLLHGG